MQTSVLSQMVWLWMYRWRNLMDSCVRLSDPRSTSTCCHSTRTSSPSLSFSRVNRPNVGHICINIYAKRSIQIYILIFSFIFLSEIVCFIVRLCIQIFVSFSDFFFFYYSHKNCVDIQHGTSDLLPLRRHVPTCCAEPNSKRPLMTSQAATRYMQLKLLYRLSLLSDWPYTEEVRIIWFVVFFN